MAIKAISLKPTDFTSKFDSEEGPTVWQIRGLTRLEWLEIENSLQSSQISLDGDNIKQISNQTNSGTVNKLLLDSGLVGWANFTDDAGATIPFSSTNKDLIPKEVRDEIATKISQLTSLDATKKGNLSGLLQS